MCLKRQVHCSYSLCLRFLAMVDLADNLLHNTLPFALATVTHVVHTGTPPPRKVYWWFGCTDYLTTRNQSASDLLWQQNCERQSTPICNFGHNRTSSATVFLLLLFTCDNLNTPYLCDNLNALRHFRCHRHILGV